MEYTVGILLTTNGGNPLFDFLVPALAVGMIFWFVFLGPQRRQEKERKKMLEELKKGDEVVTHAGIIGKVTSIKEDRVVIKIDESNNTKATFLRSAIVNVRKPKKDSNDTNKNK